MRPNFRSFLGKVSEKSTKGLKNVLFLHEKVSLTLLVIFFDEKYQNGMIGISFLY